MKRVFALLVVALLAAVGGIVAAIPAGAVTVPYTDPAVSGLLGLCDAQNHVVTSGSIDARPFAHTAVGVTKAPEGYNVAGMTATLFAYQPRKGVAPGQFSGEALAAASRYSNAAHPMSGLTALDYSVADFMDTFPTLVDGFLQLRLYLGAPDQPIYKQKYDAMDLQVTGKTWKVVKGGQPDCTAGSYTTVESILEPAQLAAAEASVAAGSQKSVAASASAGASTTANGGAVGAAPPPEPPQRWMRPAAPRPATRLARDRVRRS